MKKSIYLSLLAICLLGCNKTSKEVSITGEIKGLGTDTLYLYGMDDTLDRIDTIFTQADKFAYTTTVDTITSAYLLIHNRIEYPLFLDKGNRIHILGDTARLQALTIDGNTYNEEFTAFSQGVHVTDSLPEDTIRQRAEDFILSHHTSYVSLYLLDKYFVQKDAPDFNRIKRLIEPMGGVLQDKLYITSLSESILQAEKTEIGKFAPFLNLPDTAGVKFSRTSDDFKKKSLLINFRASWADSIANHNANVELKALYKKYKKSKHFAMLGVSLDMDKAQWIEAIERDTLSWTQVCDPGGLDSETAKQYAIRRIPTNILLSTDGRIVAKGLTGEELKKKVEELVSQAEEREKQENKRKK